MPVWIWLLLLALLAISAIGFAASKAGSEESPSEETGSSSTKPELSSVTLPAEIADSAGDDNTEHRSTADESSNGDDLPDDILHRGWLENAGITTWDDLESVDDLTNIDHIGTSRAEQISVWLSKHYPSSKHAGSRGEPIPALD